MQKMYIFLDIDGVLIKEESSFNGDNFDEDCLSLFESVIRKYDNSKIVISSSWREMVPVEMIKAFFSNDIAEKIIGVTPTIIHLQYHRYQEVMAYLKQHDSEQEAWVAIDDQPKYFSPDAPIIVTNRYQGFDNSAAKNLAYFMSGSRKLFFTDLSVTHQPKEDKKIVNELRVQRISEISEFCQVNHDELIRDYAGYEFIQDEVEAVIKRFLQVYYEDILKLYGCPEPIETLEVVAAGAGASKFVFGVLAGTESEASPKWIFGIRLYNSKGLMKDGDKTYDSADEYRVKLETHDKALLEALVDEIRIYEELENNAAKTGIDVKRNWTRFPLQKENYNNTEYGQYLDEFVYIEDRELKRLMVNLGINAFTVGGFVVGYDGRKILERPEFGLDYKLNAIVHISNTMLQSWLFTARYNDKREHVGRTIVDLKPAQFVVQADDIRNAELLPAVVIDIGPAENTENIYTYLKDVAYMKELVPAFAAEMVRKIGLSEQDKQAAKQTVYQEIINYLEKCKQTGTHPKLIQPSEFIELVDKFVTSIRAKLS